MQHRDLRAELEAKEAAELEAKQRPEDSASTFLNLCLQRVSIIFVHFFGRYRTRRYKQSSWHAGSKWYQ